MGFDVLYFPPIHPIGAVIARDANNSLHAGPDDPGSPYAIGAADGGHEAVHPQLGGIEAFRRLVAAAADHDMEIALDFAVHCSRDHPWLTDASGMVLLARRRLDPLCGESAEEVRGHRQLSISTRTGQTRRCGWHCAMSCSIWVDEGVRIFRVDNPHTKPLPFWRWLIADIRARHPDVMFLSEAFTRPAMMYRLAKIGFTQSYTYFIWRNSKRELTDYFTELTDAGTEGFLPAAPVRQHARYQSIVPAELRAGPDF